MLKDNWLERQLATVRELIAAGESSAEDNMLVEAEAKLKEAAVILDSAETITDEVHKMRYVVFNELATVSSRTGDATGAQAYYVRALKACESLHSAAGDFGLEMVALLVNIGGVGASMGRFGETEESSRKAIDVLDGLPGKGGERGELLRVFANYHLGAAIHAGTFPEEAYGPLRKAVETAEKLPEGLIGDAAPLLVECLTRLADLAARKDDHAGAADLDSQAAQISLDLYQQTDQGIFLRGYFNSMMRLVGHQHKAKSFADAEDTVFALLETFPDQADVREHALNFYKSILELDDAALEEGNLPREEAQESFKEIQSM
jgi:hypothetical protein